MKNQSEAVMISLIVKQKRRTVTCFVVALVVVDVLLERSKGFCSSGFSWFSFLEFSLLSYDPTLKESLEPFMSLKLS